jgi:hypothetical protein
VERVPPEKVALAVNVTVSPTVEVDGDAVSETMVGVWAINEELLTMRSAARLRRLLRDEFISLGIEVRVRSVRTIFSTSRNAFPSIVAITENYPDSSKIGRCCMGLEKARNRRTRR